MNQEIITAMIKEVIKKEQKQVIKILLDIPELLEEFLSEIDSDFVLNKLEENDVIEYCVNELDTNSLLNKLDENDIMEYCINKLDGSTILDSIDDDTIIEHITDKGYLVIKEDELFSYVYNMYKEEYEVYCEEHQKVELIVQVNEQIFTKYVSKVLAEEHLHSFKMECIRKLPNFTSLEAKISTI